MEEMILQFITTYGWKLALISCVGIFLLGVLKFFRLFDRIEESKQKYVYTAISAGISIIASAIYLVAVGAFVFSGFGVLAGAIYTFNQAIYAMYENFGVRAGLRKLGNIIINIVAKKQLETAKEKIEAQETVE